MCSQTIWLLSNVWNVSLWIISEEEEGEAGNNGDGAVISRDLSSSG